MTDTTTRRRERRAWVAFVPPALWLVVAGFWIARGISEHDALRLGMSAVWLAFAAYWSVRAARQVRRIRTERHR